MSFPTSAARSMTAGQRTQGKASPCEGSTRAAGVPESSPPPAPSAVHPNPYLLRNRHRLSWDGRIRTIGLSALVSQLAPPLQRSTGFFHSRVACVRAMDFLARLSLASNSNLAKVGDWVYGGGRWRGRRFWYAGGSRGTFARRRFPLGALTGCHRSCGGSPKRHENGPLQAVCCHESSLANPRSVRDNSFAHPSAA